MNKEEKRNLDDKVGELKKKIEILESALEGKDPNNSKLAAYKAELAELTGGAGKDAETYDPGGFSMSEDDWDKAQSKFAQAGLHLSEFGVPDWDTPGRSFKFPFTIVDETIDDGIESKVSTGITAKSAGILKRYLVNLGVEPTFPITLEKLKQWVPGKRAMTFWTAQVDSRTAEEGGTGSHYTKATDILPVGTEAPESLM